MLYPTGKTTKGRCLVCMEDEAPEIEKALRECGTSGLMESFRRWLDENKYCVECWQMKKHLTERGMAPEKLDEEMGGAPAAPSAPAGAPAGSAFATLGSTPGMGNVATPTNGGTNVGFYNPAKSGSGDKFPSLTVGTQAAKGRGKKKSIATYGDFVKRRKK